MRILLLRPFFSVEKFYFPRYIDEPLGLEYLCAYIKKHSPHHEIKILDAVGEGWNRYWMDDKNPEMIYQGLTLNEIINRIKNYQPDLVGVTWLFSAQNECVNQTINALKTIEAIKQANKKIITIVGGAHPSANPCATLKDNPNIDIVVYGEGEITFKELIDILELQNNNLSVNSAILRGFIRAKKTNDFAFEHADTTDKIVGLEDIQGIAFRKDGQIIINGPRPLIHDLDELPFPDRDDVPYKNYTKQNLFEFIYRRFKRWQLPEKINKLLTARLSSLPYLDKIYFKLHNKKRPQDLMPKADIITSRGCPNRCTFCAIHNLWGHRWRMRSAQNVLAEIDLLVNKYGARHINIQDDNFNVSKARTIEICQGIINRKYIISLVAPAGAFVPTLDEEVLTWLKRAGMHYLRMSIESGNQYILDNVIKKRINLSQVKPIVDAARKVGIKTEGAFMFGVPGETLQTMQESVNFAKYCDFNRFIKFIFQPFPNTELYDICVKNNYLTRDYDPRRVYITGKKSFVRTDQFGPEDVVRIARS